MPKNSFDDIVAKVTQRRAAQGTLLAAMIKVRDRYNGDYVIPMPNTSDETPEIPTMPAVIANAIDNTALRAASMSPGIFCPALDETKQTGKGSIAYAQIRKRALAYTLYKSRWSLAAYRAFRHLGGYSTAAIDVQWDYDYEMPCYKVRDPLSAYPEPKAAEDLSPPCDVAYVYAKSAEWLRYTFPQTESLIGSFPRNGGAGEATMWEVCEWIDEESIVLGVLGPQISYRSGFSEPMRFARELGRVTNRAGRCTSYLPRRVTLDRIANQVANMVGTTDLMAKLVALDIRATEQSIFPDRYILGKLGQNPSLMGGRWHDGASGEVNIIIDADSVGTLRGSPDPHGSQTIDRLERSANITMGVVPQQVGETYGALRTGRGIDSLMGASVDPRIQEMHEIMQLAMTHCNEVALESYKGYAPSKKFMGFSGWATDRGRVEFTPNEHFECTDNAVLYAIPGADIQTATVTLGQLYGTKAISLATLRQLHPYVNDGDGEERLRLIETLEEANLGAFATRASQGGIPPVDFANLLKKIRSGKSFEDAVIELDAEAQARQAAQAPPPEAPGAAPQSMPGLANPGEGAEMQPPQDSVGEPEAGLDHFRQLVQNLHAPQRIAAQAGAPS